MFRVMSSEKTNLLLDLDRDKTQGNSYGIYNLDICKMSINEEVFLDNCKNNEEMS